MEKGLALQYSVAISLGEKKGNHRQIDFYACETTRAGMSGQK